MVPKPLTINANTAPFKSSRLAIPPSPFSPRMPITPPATPPKAQHVRPCNKRALSSPTTPPPSAPLNWLWQCHVCYRAYPLGATRRCLDDGHYFCSGTTAVSKRKGKASHRRAKRHRACASEFDYSSWKAWGEWRRSENALLALHRKGGESNSDDEDDGDAMSVDSGYVSSIGDGASLPSQTQVQKKKDCWNTCDYPSECRWGSQYGVQRSSSSSSASQQSAAATCVSISGCASSSSSSSPSQAPQASSQYSPLSLSLQTQPPTASSSASESSNAYTPPTTFDGILEGTPLASALATASASLSPTSPKDVRERFWDTLLDAARQRKGSSKGSNEKKKPSSPLAKAVMTLPAVAEEDEEQAEAAETAIMDVPLFFFDAVEHHVDPDTEERRAALHRGVDLPLVLPPPPPAVPEPALSWQSASALDRSSACSGSTGRAFDFGFADKVQGALAGSTVVVAVLSDVRSSGGRADECVRQGRMAGMGRARRRLIRRKPVGL